MPAGMTSQAHHATIQKRLAGDMDDHTDDMPGESPGGGLDGALLNLGGNQLVTRQPRPVGQG